MMSRRFRGATLHFAERNGYSYAVSCSRFQLFLHRVANLEFLDLSVTVGGKLVTQRMYLGLCNEPTLLCNIGEVPLHGRRAGF